MPDPLLGLRPPAPARRFAAVVLPGPQSAPHAAVRGQPLPQPPSCSAAAPRAPRRALARASRSSARRVPRSECGEGAEFQMLALAQGERKRPTLGRHYRSILQGPGVGERRLS
eukprot:scaffold13644_cov66-Phaeocystis_antarctica.AAC.5